MWLSGSNNNVLNTDALYTNDDAFTLVKYADVKALVARLKYGSSDAQYHCHINTLVALFDKSFLKLSVLELKEMYFGSEKLSHTQLNQTSKITWQRWRPTLNRPTLA